MIKKSVGLICLIYASSYAIADDVEYENADCVESVGDYLFGRSGEISDIWGCAVLDQKTEVSDKFKDILDYDRTKYMSSAESMECNASWQYLLNIVARSDGGICGAVSDDASVNDKEVVYRCNDDQDILNAVFSDQNENIPLNPVLKACSNYIDLSMTADMIVRQENVEFLKRQGMPGSIGQWWMDTSERARTVYLITLHADEDIEFQKAMLTQFEPYKGKTLKIEFFENLQNRIKMTEQFLEKEKQFLEKEKE